MRKSSKIKLSRKYYRPLSKPAATRQKPRTIAIRRTIKRLEELHRQAIVRENKSGQPFVEPGNERPDLDRCE